MLYCKLLFMMNNFKLFPLFFLDQFVKICELIKEDLDMCFM